MRRYVRMRRRAGRLQGLIWLFGLIFLAVTGRWWPGILVLVAISVFLGMIFRERGSEEFGPVHPVEVEKTPEVVPPLPPKPEPVLPTPEFHHAEWLPLNCPRCGAPTRAADVQWSGDAIATCPYCGSNLPLKKG